MSRTIDERVVEMRFDNSRFEKNVQDTIDQLEQLKKSLKFEETSDGLDGMVSKLGSFKSKITSGFKGIFSGFTNAIGKVKNAFSSEGSGIFSGFSNAINNLKNKLSFGKNSGLDNLSNQAGQASMAIEGMGTALDGVKVKFSALQVVGATVLSKLTSSVMGFVGKGISGIFNQIKSGGWKRASDLEQARFSLEGILKDGTKVQQVLKNASDSVDGTAYALNSAAIAASQFAASGIQAGVQMEKALSGVAGIAATTNSDYDSIAHIFTTVAGNGKLMTMQLNQLSLRGMNAAASLKDYFNGVNKGSIDATASVKKAVKEMTKGKQITEGELRDLVTKGKISFEIFSEAMASTFGDQAGKANETFTGAMANIRAALARTGQMFFTGYGQLDENEKAFKGIVDAGSAVVGLFNSIRLAINRLNKDFTDSKIGVAFQKDVEKVAKFLTKLFDSINRGTYDANGKLQSTQGVFLRLANAIKTVVSAIKQVLTPIGQIVNSIFKPLKVSFNYFFRTLGSEGPGVLGLITSAFSWLADRLTLTEKRMNDLSSVVWAAMSVFKLFVTIIRGLLKIFAPILELFGIFIDTATDGMLGAAGSVAEFAEAMAEAAAKTTVFDTIAEKVRKVVDVIKEPVESIRSFINTILGLIRELGYQIGEFYKDGSGRSIWSAIMLGWDAFSKSEPFEGLINGLKYFRETLRKTMNEMTGWNWMSFKEMFSFGKDKWHFGKDTPGGGVLGGVIASVNEGAWRIATIFAAVYKTITGKDIYDKIQGFWETTLVDIEIKVYNGIRKIQDLTRKAFSLIGSSYKEGGGGFGGIINAIFNGMIAALGKISNFIKNRFGVDISKVVNVIIPKLQNARDIVVKFIDDVVAKYPKLKALNDGIKNFITKVADWVKALKGGQDGWKSIQPSKAITPFIKGSEKMQKVAGVLDKVYVAIKNFASKATPKIADALDKVYLAFKNFGNYIKEKDIVTKLKNAFNKIKDAIVKAASTIKSAFNKTRDALKSGWEGFRKVADPIVDVIKNIATKLKSAFDVLKNNVSRALSHVDFSKPIDVLKGFFKALGDTLPTILNMLKDFGTKIVDGIKTLFGKDEQDGLDNQTDAISEFGEEINPAAETLKKAGGTLGDAFTTVNDAFKKVGKNANMADILSKFASGFKAFVDFMKPIAGFLSSVGKKFAPSISDFFSKLGKAFQNADIGEIATLIKGGALFIIADALHKYINSIIKLGPKSKNSHSVLDSIRGAFDQIKDFFKNQVGKWLKVGTLISFAFALSVLANAVLILGSMNAGDALQGTVIVLLLMRELKKIMKLADKIADNESDIMKFGNVATKLGIALWVLTKSVKNIGDMDVGKALVGIIASLVLLEAMVGFIEELHFVAHSISTTDMAGIDALVSLITSMSLVAVVLAFAVRMIGKLETGQAIQGLAGLLLIIMAMTGVLYALDVFVKDGDKAEVGAQSLLMVASGLLVAAFAIQTLANMGWSGMLRGLVGMIAALGLMVGALAILSLLSFEGFGALIAAGAIAIVAISMLTFAAATHVLASGLNKLTPALTNFGSKVDWSSIGKAVVFFIGMAAVGVVAAVAFSILAGACLGLALGLAPLGVALTEIAAAFVIFAYGVLIIAWAVGAAFGAMTAGIITMIETMEKLDTIDGFSRKLSKFKDVVSTLTISAVKLGFAATVLGMGLAVLGVGFGIFAIAAVIFGAATNIIAVGATKLAVGIGLLAVGLKKFGDALVYLNNLDGVTDGLGKFSKVLFALVKVAGVMVLLGIGTAVLGAGLIPLGIGLTLVVGPLAALAIAFAKVAAALAIISKIAPEALGKLKDSLTIVIDAAGKFIADFILMIPKLISGVFKGLAESAGEILANLEATLAQFLEPMAEMGMDIVEALLGAFDEHAESFAEKGASAATKFMEGLGRKADGLVKAAYDMCMNFLNAFDKYIPEFANKGFDVIIGMVDNITEAVETKAPELRAAIERLGQAIKDGIQLIIHGDTKSKAKEAGEQVPEGAKEGLAKDADFASGSNGIFDKILTSLKNTVLARIDEVTSTTSGVPGKAAEGIDSASDGTTFQSTMNKLVSFAVDALKQAVKNKIDVDFPSIGKLWNNAMGKIFDRDSDDGIDKASKKKGSKAKKGLEGQKSTVASGVAGWENAMGQKIAGGTSVNTAIKEKSTQAKTTADNYKKNFQNVGKHWMESLTKAVKSHSTSAVIPAVKNVGQKAKSSADTYQNNFYNVGKHWMDGLTNGIKQNGQKAINAAKAIAQKVAKITASTMQEKSPSRLSYKYGKYWDEGLANGISALAGKVANVAKQVAKSAVDPLLQSISKASDYISNTDTSFEPVVAPVMDMTNVRQGAYDISNMLYAAQSAGLANGMSNQFNANSYEQMTAQIQVDNSDLLRSIGNLSDEVEDLKGVVGNLKVVMSTGELVGALRDPMDQALGRKANHITRGG